MNSRPIIFDGESVRAILAGTKTQTRRVVKNRTALEWLAPDDLAGGSMFSPAFVANPENFLSPYGFAGDELWVREAFCSRFVEPGNWDGWYYAASDPDVVKFDDSGFTVWRKNGEEASPWISPLRMPREASRITLRVTDVRVERLQEITEADAKAEGVETDEFLDRMDTILSIAVEGCGPVTYPTVRTEFERRWESINAKRGFGWDVNPWVWVVTFERVDTSDQL